MAALGNYSCGPESVPLSWVLRILGVGLAAREVSYRKQHKSPGFPAAIPVPGPLPSLRDQELHGGRYLSLSSLYPQLLADALKEE